MNKREAKDRYLAGMRNDRIVLSPLSEYLTHVETVPGAEKTADQLRAIIADTFTSEIGIKALMLFEKAALNAVVPNGGSESALRETNAVRNFVADIRRIVSNA